MSCAVCLWYRCWTRRVCDCGVRPRRCAAQVRRVPAELLQDTWKSTRGRRRLGPALQTHGVGGPWRLSSRLVRGCFGHLSSTVQRPGGLLDPLSTVAAVVGTNHASLSSGRITFGGVDRVQQVRVAVTAAHQFWEWRL